MKSIALVIAAVAACLTVGCGDRGRPSGYTVEIANRTGGTIEDAAARSPSYVASVGIIVNGGQKMYGPFHGNIPASFQISWQMGTGAVKTVSVSTPSLPADFNGTIRFTIQPNGDVTVAGISLGPVPGRS